jgi:hypothetical protein
MTKKLDFTKPLEFNKDNFNMAIYSDYTPTISYLGSRTIGEMVYHYIHVIWTSIHNANKKIVYVYTIDIYGNRYTIDNEIYTTKIVQNKKIVKWYNLYQDGPSLMAYSSEEDAKKYIDHGQKYIETRSYEYYESNME